MRDATRRRLGPASDLERKNVGVGRRARRRVAEVSETKLLGRRARDHADEALRPAAPPPRHRGVPRAPDRGQAQSGGLPRARALFFLQRERRGISLVSFVIILAVGKVPTVPSTYLPTTIFLLPKYL